ncbi:MAG: YdeI/OmpD-associated family protein [Bacteroidota bacterium]
MSTAEKIEAFYAKEHSYKEGIAVLRELALKTELEETYKWNFPVYTLNGKNVLGICAFKSHFGVWFFNGVFLSDPKGVLENAQEGKTKSMRHWKFLTEKDIDKAGVLAYMQEAQENQRKGISLSPGPKKETVIPQELSVALNKDSMLKALFDKLAPYKQREFCEYISEAKQEKTKQTRLDKILLMIAEGISLNDKYRGS